MHVSLILMISADSIAQEDASDKDGRDDYKESKTRKKQRTKERREPRQEYKKSNENQGENRANLDNYDESRLGTL